MTRHSRTGDGPRQGMSRPGFRRMGLTARPDTETNYVTALEKEKENAARKKRNAASVQSRPLTDRRSTSPYNRGKPADESPSD
jgi:hypothetical protein